ncbi:MAG: hypothetical protein ACJAT2_003725 [Bacteriovoracaceae bacterium]|jgi:hypothetical protein
MKKIFLAFIAVFWASVSLANSATIVFIKGEVKDAKNVTLKKDQKLPQGTIINTGAGSFAVLQLPHGNKVKVGENSQLKISKLSKKKVGQTRLALFKGSSFIKVIKSKLAKGEKSKLILRTRTTAMGVRGTEFFASYGTGKDVWMCVNEGIVSVRSKTEKKATLVKAGEGIIVKDGNKTSEPKPLKWTKKLNWNMDPASGDLENKVSIESAYTDLLDQDYD